MKEEKEWMRKRAEVIRAFSFALRRTATHESKAVCPEALRDECFLRGHITFKDTLPSRTFPLYLTVAPCSVGTVHTPPLVFSNATPVFPLSLSFSTFSGSKPTTFSPVVVKPT